MEGRARGRNNKDILAGAPSPLGESEGEKQQGYPRGGARISSRACEDIVAGL